MIITKSEPFTKDEILELQEEFGSYIKTVIDVKTKVCSAGCSMHFDSEKILLENGSDQENIWGGGIDLRNEKVDFNSFINIRPKQDNDSNEILSPEIKLKYKELTEYFFEKVL